MEAEPGRRFLKQLAAKHELVIDKISARNTSKHDLQPQVENHYYGLLNFAEKFRSFFERHFGHWDISVICLTVVLELTLTVFISMYFYTFWPK